VLRLERDGLWLHVTALADTEPSARILGRHGNRGDVQTLTDDGLGVSVICVATPARDVADSTAALDRLSDLTAHVAVAEIEAHLAMAAG
jgi:hypothetical protein